MVRAPEHPQVSAVCVFVLRCVFASLYQHRSPPQGCLQDQWCECVQEHMYTLSFSVHAFCSWKHKHHLVITAHVLGSFSLQATYCMGMALKLPNGTDSH